MQNNFREYANLFMGIKESYPKSGLFENDSAIRFWYKMLSDIPIEDLSKAVATHISTSKYAPTISEIREIASRKGRVEKDYSFGYGLLRRAIRNFGFYRETEALDWIREQDPLAATVVSRLGFQSFCLSENEMTDRANFRMAYENTKAIEMKQQQLPQGLRDKELEQNKKALDFYINQIGRPGSMEVL